MITASIDGNISINCSFLVNRAETIPRSSKKKRTRLNNAMIKIFITIKNETRSLIKIPKIVKDSVKNTTIE